jgi:hypothetical protein
MSDEPQKLPEAKASESASPVWNQQIAEMIFKAIGGGGFVATFMALFISSDLPKVAMAGALGSGAPVVYAFFDPIARRAKKGAEKAGEGTADFAESAAKGLVAKATGVDDRYLELQKEDCQTSLCDGITQVFSPLLEEIFVPLPMSYSPLIPGWETIAADLEGDDEVLAVMRSPEAGESQIWQLLKAAESKSVYRRMAILAWGGYGKTTLLRHIAYIYSSKQHRRYKVGAKVPVFLALKTYGKLVAQQPEMTLPDVIMQKHIPRLSPDLHLAADWAKEKLKSGEMVVLLDGLDEVSESIRSVVTKWLKRELALYPQTIAILTSRPKAYTEQPPASRLEMRMTIWVESFTKSQQQAFIDRWYDYQEVYANNGRTTSDVTRRAADHAAGLMAQIRARPEIEDLAKIPLLLNMIATFHRLSPNVQLPKRKVDLYQAICKLQLCDRPGAKELETLLTETDAQTILQKLALEMLLNNREKTIERDALLTRLTTYLETENESVKAHPFLDEVVRVSELLVEREVQEYEFAHWSFQEYLAAKELFDRKREQEIIDRLAIPEWKPMILMYVGLLKNPSGLIRLMVDRGLTDLAAACLHETTKQVDADVVEELDRLTTVVIVSTYAKLEALLKAGEWREADQETYRLMIKAVGKEDGQLFSREDLENFPCEDLLTIDRLWVEASNGHFGFSVQKKIWQECGSPKFRQDWDRFCVKVGWQNAAATYVNYTDLKFSPHLSPKGELPNDGMEWGNREDWVLFSRAETCKL